MKTYKTAKEWIKASIGAEVDNDIIEGMAAICVTKKSIHSIRKTQPSPTKQPRQYFTWKAYKLASHAATWGNLAPWNEGLTAALMLADKSDREYFERAFDQLTDCARRRKKRA